MKTIILTILISLAFVCIGHAELPKNAHPYLKRMYPIAQKVSLETGIPWEVMLAQSALESGYGRSALARKNHAYFGIKADSRWHGPRTYSKGSWYRSYSSAEESFRDYAKFIIYNRRYYKALKQKDTRKFIVLVAQAGYCPQPGYPRAVIDIMERNGI